MESDKIFHAKIALSFKIPKAQQKMNNKFPMRKPKIHKTIIYAFISLLIISCRTSNNVVSNFGIQKRKYTKGYYITKGSGTAGDSNKSTHNTEETLTSSIDDSPSIQGTLLFPPKTLSSEQQITNTTEDLPSIIEKNEDFYPQETKPKKPSETDETKKMDRKSIRPLFANISRRQIDLKPQNIQTLKDDKDREDGENKSIWKFILGILLCIVGFSPLGILLTIGKGEELQKNLVLWTLGIILTVFSLILLAVIFFSLAESIPLIILYSVLSSLGSAFLFVAWLQGLIKVIKHGVQ